MGKESKEGKGSNTNRPACAACRHQRRKCKEDCVLAPYFPTDKSQEYEAVHRVFGYSNIAKMLTNLDEQGRKEAIKSFEWEAMMWNQDPVYGPLGAYNKACNIITQLLNLNHHHQQQQPNQTVTTTSDPKLTALTQNSSPFTNNVNWAPLVVNNVVQDPNSVSYSYVNSFRGVMQNEDPKLFDSVPASNAMHPALLLHQKSSILQPNYLQGLTSVAGSDVVFSSGTNQPSQVRDFGYYNENNINEQVGMQRECQGTVGSVENIYSDGRGAVIPGENSVIEGNIDSSMVPNRVGSQISEFQHPVYYTVGHTRFKRE